METAARQTCPPIAIPVPMGAIAAFCKQWDITEFALFGSVVSDNFRPDSDVDVLVTFAPNARPTLLTLAAMQRGLEQLLGRGVDLLERRGLDQCKNPRIRDSVLASLRVVYAR